MIIESFFDINKVDCKRGVKELMTLFLEYPKCSTCQKAKKWLEASGMKFEDRNIVLENPTEEELKAWIKKSGLEIKRWFNTSGLKYKELGLKDKLVHMSEKEKIALLASDGMLVKRPVLVTEEKVLVGFKEEEWRDIIC